MQSPLILISVPRARSSLKYDKRRGTVLAGVNSRYRLAFEAAGWGSTVDTGVFSRHAKGSRCQSRYVLKNC